MRWITQEQLQIDRQLVGGKGVFRPVAAGAAVGDDERALAVHRANHDTGWTRKGHPAPIFATVSGYAGRLSMVH